MIVIMWDVLHDQTTYVELGSDHFVRRNETANRQRYLVKELERLGNRVTLESIIA
jgi:hypothetical protein